MSLKATLTKMTSHNLGRCVPVYISSLHGLSCTYSTAQGADLRIDADLFSSQTPQKGTDLPPTQKSENGTAFWLLLSLERSCEGPSALEFIPLFAQNQPPTVFDLLGKRWGPNPMICFGTGVRKVGICRCGRKACCQ